MNKRIKKKQQKRAQANRIHPNVEVAIIDVTTFADFDVMDAETADKIGAALRSHGFGLTEMKVIGRDDNDRYMLMSTLRRKLAPEAMELIQSVAPNAVITVSDVKSLRGGYMRQAGNRRIKKDK